MVQELIDFPCEFAIKVIGQTCDELEIAVLGIIRQHVPELAETAIKIRSSENGKYIAMTITIHAESRTQLDSIYSEINACEYVITTL